MPWYKGESLLEYLERVDVKEEVENTGFVLPIQRVCRPDHTFRGFQGQIASGSVKVGDEVTALPSGEKASVVSIHVGDQNVDEASVGMPVNIQLNREIDISRGCVLEKKSTCQTGTSRCWTQLHVEAGDTAGSGDRNEHQIPN